MIAWLLLGPTGVGKTTLGRAAAAELGWAFCDLDQALSQRYGVSDLGICVWRWGADGFRQRSLAYLHTLQQDTRTWLVAVGAGSQWADQQGELLCYPCLYLTLQAEMLWRRNQNLRGDPRSLDHFVAVEFTARQSLYQGAKSRLDLSDLATPAAVQAVLQHLSAPDPDIKSPGSD